MLSMGSLPLVTALKSDTDFWEEQSGDSHTTDSGRNGGLLDTVFAFTKKHAPQVPVQASV